LVSLRIQDDPGRGAQRLKILVECGQTGTLKRDIVDKGIDAVASIGGTPNEAVAGRLDGAAVVLRRDGQPLADGIVSD
jgi:hypothetical protein